MIWTILLILIILVLAFAFFKNAYLLVLALYKKEYKIIPMVSLAIVIQVLIFVFMLHPKELYTALTSLLK